MSSSSSKEAENDQPDSSKYEEACAGLTPVLEAVDELPASGSPIAPAVHNRVRHFFIQQISTANPTAAGSGSLSTGSNPLRPKDLQDTKQLLECLQKHVKDRWSKLGCKGITPLVSAAIQLVADAAHQVARQQLVEKKSQAYSILLDEGYRAGVMAQACAALRAAIGLRIITHTQLAHVLVIARKAGAHAVFAGFKSFTTTEGIKLDHAATRSYAWDHLKPYYVGSSSSSTPAWTLNDSDLWDVLLQFVQVTNSCLPHDDDDEGVPGSQFELEMDMPDPEVGSQLAAMLEQASAAQKEGRSAAGYRVLPLRPSRSSSGSASGSGNKAAAAAGSKAAASKGGSSGGGSGDKATAAAGNRAAAGKDSSSTAAPVNGSGNGSGNSTPAPGADLFEYSRFWKPVDMTLPLDDCPLLAARCRGLGPVLEAVAGLQTGSSASVCIAPVVMPLSAGIKHYTLQQLAATDGGSGGSGSCQPGQGGPRRRTVVPMYQPEGAFTFSGIPDKLGMLMQIMFAEMPGQLDLLTGTVPSIVQGVVKQVAKEQVVEKNSAAFNELVEAAVFAGLAAMACTWLYTNLGISLRTEEQFCSALVHTCNACTAAKHKDPGADVKRSIAFNVYQTLKQLTAPAAEDSSSGGGSSGGGGGSGSGGLTFAMPKCGLDAAYTYLETFSASLAFLTECEGVITKAQALAAAPWEAVSNVASGPLGPELVSRILPGLADAMAAGSSKEAATGDQAADWGKGKGLAGLKGLFSGKQADTQQAVKPVTARANSSGAVVASSSAGKALAPAAAGKGAAQAAAAVSSRTQQAASAAAVSSSSKTSSSSSSSSSKAGSSSSSGKAHSISGSKFSKTPPELLVEANLKQWYCSPDTFGRSVVEPLPDDSLKLLVKLKLHTKYRDHGWNALHYACASHRHVLVKQLLDAGASVSEPEDILNMQPLHLACLGRLDTADDFYELTQCTTLSSFTTFVAQGSYADARVVALLLDRGANPSASIGKQCPELASITPLHILSLWTADGEPAEDTVFANPFVGRACWICKNKQTPALPVRLSSARSDLLAASEGLQGLRSSQCLDGLEIFVDPTGNFTAICAENLDWDDPLQCAFLHVTAAQVLLSFGAEVDARGGLHFETPLMFAAGEGNAAMTALLLAAGADPELTRVDGARALEIAADQGFPRVGWALLCYGAQALPAWYVSGKPPPLALTPANLSHEMLVCHAVQCDDEPWNLRFLERLLADGALIEGVWAETGETPLLLAISYRDPEMVRLLVMAGANVEARVTIGYKDPAVAHLLYKSTPDEGAAACKEILQVLIDAGADLHSWQSEATEYDYVQAAANMSHVDAALKLVEAGCKWQLPKAQHVIGGSVYYAPEILCCQIPTLFNKRPYVESRFKRAEKLGRQKRAAIATALQPWLSPTVTSECKEATLKCLVAAGVTPGQPHSRVRSPIPSLRGKAPWAASAAAAARQQEGRAGAVSQLQEGQAGKDRELVLDDVDALLAEIESVGSKGGTGSAAGASGGSKVASKKKKKETAAQKEAKKKQQLRVQLLQQQQEQRSGSSSDSDDGEGSSSSRDEKAGLVAEASASAAANEADMQDSFQQGSESDVDDDQLLAIAARASPPAAAVQQHAQAHAQKHEEVKQKLLKGKKGKAAQQQQAQAQAQASTRNPVARAAAGEGTTQSPGSQPRPAANPAAAAPQTPPQAMQAALNAAMSQRASAGAGIANANITAVQQTHVVMPGAVAAAPVAAAGAAAAGPTAVPVRPAFLPPHLRMSMPGSAPAARAAAAPPAAATAAPQAHAVPVQVQMQQNLPAQQVQDSQQGAGLRQRMIEMAQQHQMQQQALRQDAKQQQQHMAAPQQVAQQEQQHKGEGPPMPALPHAMMALLSSSAQQHKQQQGPAAAAAQTGHKGHAGHTAGHHAEASTGGASAGAGQKPAGAKRQPPGGAAAAASRAGPTTLQQQQQQHKQQHGRAQPQPRATPAGADAAGRGAAGVPVAAAPSDGAAKGPKLCIVCSERRRNMLLIPCNHMVLCDVCADQLHGRGQLDSCPHCKQPCKQRIRVHKS